MLTYKYTANNPQTGEQVKATVEADSEPSAAKLIREQGLTPIDIAVVANGDGLFGRLKNHVKTKDRILFSRQLSTLINAGLPLLQALRSVNDQTTSKPLRLIVSQIISDIEAGTALSAAISKYPKVFNQIYISMIAAGETSGTLDRALDRLAMQQEKDADVNAKIRGAMIYPAIVLLVMVGVVGFMVVKVLPQVKTLYQGLPGSGHLPLLTRILLDFSDFVIHYWWIVLIVLAVLAFFFVRWIPTGPGRSFVDKAKMRAWPIGPLFMKVYMARFTRSGSTLVASGVPLLQMLEITSDVVNNVHVKNSIVRAISKVRGGKSLSESIENDPNFLPLVPNMLHIGEQSGAMEQMMSKAADYYEKEVDNEIANISSIIEPVMMVLLGIVAFIIVAAVLLPIYGLAGNSSLTGS